MVTDIPTFLDSPYFVDDPGNWHLKPGAPPEIVEEFNKYMCIKTTEAENPHRSPVNQAGKPENKFKKGTPSNDQD